MGPRPPKGPRNHRGDRKLSVFGAPRPPKGSKILEKAAMLAADCRLQDWKDWRTGCRGSNTPWGRRTYKKYFFFVNIASWQVEKKRREGGRKEEGASGSTSPTGGNPVDGSPPA